jgi:energy-coupling factor transporter ATP-binding protein EcfA2
MNNSPSPPPFFNHFWPKLVLILATLGVPAAAIPFFGQFITEHPLLALIIGLLYEMSVLIFGFVGQVWQKLQNRWVDRCVEWLDNIIQGNVSRYQKEYYQYLYYQHRDFDVKGLTTLGTFALELDQIFVELRIDPTTLKQVSRSLVPLPRTLSEGDHSIWDYLAFQPLKNQHLVVIGPPGSGKTTLLKHITLTLVTHRKRHHHREKIQHTFPILLFLRDHVQSIEKRSDFSLVYALRDHLKRWEQPEPPDGWIEKQLARRRCLIMLDGLDEVANPRARLKVVSWVQRQMIAFKENRFVVTSRPFGYRSNPLSSVTVLEVRPFSDEQIERFVHRWYLANEIMRKQKDDPGVRMRARVEAKDLLQRLRNVPALFALTVNPLLLTMITTVHRYSGQLPGNRMALYAEICEVFLGKRQQARGQVLELTSAQMQLVLEPLAYSLMLKGKRDVTLAEAQDAIREPLKRVKLGMLSEAFLQLVENASGLLLEKENGVYGFAHLTFQEYLTAAHIREKRLGDTLIAHVEESWWRETIRLYCAMSDATPIIAACLKADHPSVRALTLALDYAEEARDIQPAMKARLETILSQGVEDADLERRRVVAEVFLTRRQRQMVYVKEGVYGDTSLVTCAEYQIFIDEQRAQGRYYQPDHWNSASFPTGSGQAPILGMRRSDALAFCNWLTARDKEGWHYRLPLAGEWPLQERRREKELYAETGYWLGDEPWFVWSQGKLSDVLRRQLSDCTARVRARVLKGDLFFDSVLDRVLVHNRDLTLALDHARGLALDLDRDRIHDRARDLALALDRDRAITDTRDLDRARDRALALALDFTYNLAHNHALVRVLDLYVTISLLQERIAGNILAYEGILLVKDREPGERGN